MDTYGFLAYVTNDFIKLVDDFIDRNYLDRETVYRALDNEYSENAQRIRNPNAFLWMALKGYDLRPLKKATNFGSILKQMKERGIGLDDIQEIIQTETEMLNTTYMQWEELERNDQAILKYMRDKKLKGADVYRACFKKSHLYMYYHKERKYR